jgi:hypothetical protein
MHSSTASEDHLMGLNEGVGGPVMVHWEGRWIGIINRDADRFVVNNCNFWGWVGKIFGVIE